MKPFRTFLLAITTLALTLPARADEGMWLPLLINKYNYAAMQKMGLRLTAEQIYSINQNCLKDAIVVLDHGSCTGSIISNKGLLLTNHHCGYDAIAENSSVNTDYLTNGFWAMKADEEIPLEDKSVSFLLRMEDVTKQVLGAVTDKMEQHERDSIIEANIEKIKSDATGESNIEASVESMFEGNEYYLFIYETYNDVRMVGAPPSGIGKFGGETDNWMWPRHNGDFCLLRVYSGADGKPAEYSKENIPLKPKYFLPVSLNGVKEGDFSMIMGYPGSTDRYLTSKGINLKLSQENPASIRAKWAKIDLMKQYMDEDDVTRIAYADDYAYLTNFWKKAVQESKALVRLHVADDKEKTEQAFVNWLNADENRKEKYGDVMPAFDTYYKTMQESRAQEAQTYAIETITGVSPLYFAFQTGELIHSFGTDEYNEMLETNMKKAEKFYKTYNPQLEKELMVRMMLVYVRNVDKQFIPGVYNTIIKKYKSNLNKFVDDVFKKSIYATKERFMEFMKRPDQKTMGKDPMYNTALSFLDAYLSANVIIKDNEEKFSIARRKYIAGLREMMPEKTFYPDANSTMRLTYGQVKPYKPADGIKYDYYTTLEGVMQKEDTANKEFFVPQKLKDLYNAKDFGQYAQDGEMRVCFLTTHDITGGNSGSPVINGNGELIGLAFDGNSESMSSDIQYDAALQRTISVDIRYVLFVIDKYAGAGYLVDEMKLVKK